MELDWYNGCFEGNCFVMQENIKVLTIDDETFVRKSFRHFLEDCGFTVFEAANGNEGIQVFENAKPDIVLLDLRMPEMDGFKLLTYFHDNEPEFPVIVVSGTGDISSVLEALRLGAWDYLLKPIHDMNVLLHAISKSLKESGLRKENKQYQDDLEKQLRKAQKMEETAALTRRFVQDLNNILTPVLGHADMLMNYSDPGDMVYQRSGKIRKAAYRAADLVNQIISLPGKDKEKVRALQLRYVIKEVADLLKESIPSTIAIREEIDKKCGLVAADSTQVYQLLMNLCVNVYNAMEHDGGEFTLRLKEIVISTLHGDKKNLHAHGGFSNSDEIPEICDAEFSDGDSVLPSADLSQFSHSPDADCSSLGIDQAGRYALIQVTDIDQNVFDKIKEKLFDPCYAAKDRKKYTGLSLTIAENIVRRLKGEIHLAALPENGTCFSVLLPVIHENIDLKQTVE